MFFLPCAPRNVPWEQRSPEKNRISCEPKTRNTEICVCFFPKVWSQVSNLQDWSFGWQLWLLNSFFDQMLMSVVDDAELWWQVTEVSGGGTNLAWDRMCWSDGQDTKTIQLTFSQIKYIIEYNNIIQWTVSYLIIYLIHFDNYIFYILNNSFLYI